jgi:hypothetical protein
MFSIFNVLDDGHSAENICTALDSVLSDVLFIQQFRWAEINNIETSRGVDLEVGTEKTSLLPLAPEPSLGLGLFHKIRLNFLEASQQFSFFTG